MLLTGLIINAGVEQGIEKWSRRLMPSLLILLLALIAYVLTREGATEGLRHYLVPDFSQLTNPDLIVSALGQAFFFYVARGWHHADLWLLYSLGC